MSNVLFSYVVETLKKEQEEMRRDVARYRWLRDNPEDIPVYECFEWQVTYLNKGSGAEAGVCTSNFQSFDEAVDFAIARAGGG